jgi:threonine aldolase
VNGFVELRSDTLTQPTPGMRRAMAEAPVGDDVYGEDPSVNRLEQTVAAWFGAEAAVFVPSGTMGNQVGLRTLCPPADEILCEASAHIVTYELGGSAQLGGMQTRTVIGERGVMDPEVVAAQIHSAEWGMVPTRVVAVENTHNNGGGTVWPLGTLRRLRELTAERGLAVHCDGARIWNAHVASGTPLATYGELFDSLSVCLSKGLGAPVGSLLVTTAERADEARVLRKRLGGGWRQAGILAAAGLYALQHHVDRLAEDHARARRVADMLADAVPGCIDPALVETNIVIVDVSASRLDSRTFARRAKDEGILVGLKGPSLVRLVTHLDVDDAGVERAGKVLADLLRG